MMNEKLIRLNIPNKNNRIYSTDEVRKAILKLEDQHLLGTIGLTKSIMNFALEDVAFEVSNLHIEDDWLFGYVDILDTPKGSLLSELLTGDTPMVFRPNSMGKIFADGAFVRVSDLSFVSCIVIPEEDAA